MNFGKNLKKIRKSLNITQGELADVMEVSQRTISHYENSECQPDILTLCRLAYSFNMSVEHLIGYEGGKDDGGYMDLREITMKYWERRRKNEDLLRAKINAGKL